MSRKKADAEAGEPTDVPFGPDLPPEQSPEIVKFNESVDALACAVKKLCDAGMSGGVAGEIALEVLKLSSGCYTPQ